MTIRTLTIPFLLAAMMLSAGFTATAQAATTNKHRADARLLGHNVMKGKAKYREERRNGVRFQRFDVEVERALPNKAYNVWVNGEKVGKVRTNAAGRGKLQLRTAAFIDSPGDGDPIPAGFPKLSNGDIAVVGPLSGVFFKRSSGGGGGSGGSSDDTTSWYKLEGKAEAGNDQVQADVEYRERMNQGQLERRFKVEIEDGAPNTSYTVKVEGQIVGVATTDGLGFVEWQLRTAAFIDSPGDGDPMPASFPTIQAGDKVRVGSLVVEMAND